jgi:PAS domain S-box-containing protein
VEPDACEAPVREFVSRSRDRHPGLPVIALTRDHEAARRAVEAGATETFVRSSGADAALLARRLDSVFGTRTVTATPARPETAMDVTGVVAVTGRGTAGGGDDGDARDQQVDGDGNVAAQDRGATGLDRNTRIATLLEAAPYPFAHVRFEGDEPVVWRANDAFEETFGRRAAARGATLATAVRPSDEGDRWMRADGAVDREVTCETGGGEHRTFRLRTAVRHGPEGAEGVAAFVDRTACRRRTEQLEQLRRNVTDVVWMSDPDAESDSPRFVSDAFEDIWGRPPSVLDGPPASFVDAIHPGDRDRVREVLDGGAGTEYEVTYRVVRPDGSVRWVRDRASAVTRDGDPVQTVGVARDITELKRREQELGTFRNAVEHAAHAISWTDPHGVIEYVNRAFERQTGYGADEAVGRSASFLWAGVHEDDLYERIWEAVVDGETWEGEVVRRTKDGERYIADQTVSGVREDGELSRVVTVATDVTDRRRREQQLSVLQRVLRHDLRNNLNEILLAAETIERTGTDADPQVTAIKETVEETLSLTRNIKRMQELFEHEDAEVKQVVDLAATAAEQVSTLRAERPGASVSADLPATAPVVANGLVHRAVRNVLRNAVEHNDADTPEVTVSMTHRPETGETALRIVDNGPGIPDSAVSVLETEEEPLHHLDGFGLWLVQWVVSLSGGDVEFETGVATDADAADHGTAVTMVLPAREPPRDSLSTAGDETTEEVG